MGLVAINIADAIAIAISQRYRQNYQLSPIRASHDQPKSTHVYREIHEQPYVLARLLQGERGAAQALAAEIKRRDIQYVVVAAARHQR